MVHPDDGDEEIADRVADDGRPEFEQSIEARSVRRAQVQGENCNNDCKDGIREGIQAFCLRRVHGHHSRPLPMQACPPVSRRPDWA
ncbi:hypothetical protein BKD09_45950 [Bradyrhizobium japonicum]|uniref:Uncharacterized protein n=1 Tax=Bradyrhizobium japonicum TaxID=375 RepID=A0A1L3FQX0_BRAJP|nr:hypothetical protein BKD09_45950 [Bradyrhizobium japonicum]